MPLGEFTGKEISEFARQIRQEYKNKNGNKVAIGLIISKLVHMVNQPDVLIKK